jgi:hypothetical protein
MRYTIYESKSGMPVGGRLWVAGAGGIAISDWLGISRTASNQGANMTMTKRSQIFFEKAIGEAGFTKKSK